MCWEGSPSRDGKAPSLAARSHGGAIRGGGGGGAGLGVAHSTGSMSSCRVPALAWLLGKCICRYSPVGKADNTDGNKVMRRPLR